MPTLINAGIGGNTTAEMLERLDRDCLTHRPDLVILLAGTNDCCNSQKLRDPADIAATYAALAERILAVSRLVLATPPAVHPPYLQTRHPEAAYAGLPAVERLARARAAMLALAGRIGVPCVDLAAITAGAGLIGTDPRCWLMNEANSGRTDGVHPTADGYRALAAAIGAVVLALHPRPERIVCLGDSITSGQGVPGAGGVDGENWPGWLGRMLAAAGPCISAGRGRRPD
jgi:lysophospholipase L1-like esterase